MFKKNLKFTKFFRKSKTRDSYLISIVCMQLKRKKCEIFRIAKLNYNQFLKNRHANAT